MEATTTPNRQVLLNKPTVADFVWLVDEAKKLGYQPNDEQQPGSGRGGGMRHHVSEWVEQRGDSETDKQSEFGMHYRKPVGNLNTYKAKVWPSFVLRLQAYKKRDHGFALIENERGEAVFWAPPTKRTKNFTKNLLGWSRICLELVEDRPTCSDPECGELMHIYGNLKKGYWWQCINEELHGLRLPRQEITVGLSKVSLKFFEMMSRRWQYDSKDPRRKSKRKGSFGNRRTDKWNG